MSDALSRTLQHGDFDSVFREVDQSEPIDWTTQGELRLFHLDIRNNKINVESLKKYVYLSIGDYVFSRAVIERFAKQIMNLSVQTVRNILSVMATKIGSIVATIVI